MAIQVPVVFRGDADDLVDDLDRSLRGSTRKLFGEFGRQAADRFSSSFNRETSKFSDRFRSGFSGSLTAALQGAVIRDPRVLALFAASLVALFPAMGSLAAGAFVLAFGTGLAGLGITFAAMDKEVKSRFKTLGKNLKKEMRRISEPFEETLLVLANVIRETFDVFAPELAKAFKKMAPVLSQFIRQLGEAFEQLAPVIQPVANAFNAILREAGPRLVPFFKELADAITRVARSIRQDPDVFVDIFGNILGIIPKLFNFIAFLSRLQDRLEAFFTSLSNSRVGNIFRDMISNITGAVKDFFSILKESGEIGKTFEALKKFVEPLIPIFEKTGKAVGKVLGDGLREIATVITTDLLPAFREFLPAIQPVIKFLLEVVGTAVVEAFKGAVQAIKGAIQIISGVLNLFADILQGNWSEVWGDLKQIAVGAFNTIVGVIRVFLSVTIIGAFRRFIIFLTKGLWIGLFKTLLAGTKKGFSGIQRIFTSTLHGLVRAVRGMVRGVGNFFRDLFRGIINITTNGWKVLRSAFGGPLRAILTVVTQTFRGILNSIIGAWRAISNATVNAWTAIRTAVSNGVQKAISVVREMPSTLVSIIRGAAGALFAAGAALIQGLADGVREKINDVINTVKDGLGKIKGMLPGSPIKSGPLKSWNGGKPGKRLMEIIAKGIRDGSPKALAAVVKALSGISDLVDKQLKREDIGKKLADRIQKQLQQMSKAVEKEAARIAKRLSDRLNFAQSITSNIRGELDLEAIFASSGGTASGFTAGIAAIANRIKRFARKLNGLRRKGIPAALIAEVASLGSEKGIPIADILLAATKKETRDLRNAFQEFAQAAGLVGNTVANAQFGTPEDIRNGRRRRRRDDDDRNRGRGRRMHTPSGGIKVEQNFYGPTTSGGRLREIDWTLRYATMARSETVGGVAT